jgi:hypothetical protein
MKCFVNGLVPDLIEKRNINGWKKIKFRTLLARMIRKGMLFLTYVAEEEIPGKMQIQNQFG